VSVFASVVSVVDVGTGADDESDGGAEVGVGTGFSVGCSVGFGVEIGAVDVGAVEVEVGSSSAGAGVSVMGAELTVVLGVMLCVAFFVVGGALLATFSVGSPR
jgi:hypothetical protein